MILLIYLSIRRIIERFFGFVKAELYIDKNQKVRIISRKEKGTTP